MQYHKLMPKVAFRGMETEKRIYLKGSSFANTTNL
jgi:hypothetical protein